MISTKACRRQAVSDWYSMSENKNKQNLMVPQKGPEDRTGIVRKSMDLLGNAVTSLKGQDLNELVDRYTSEVTLVLEGMSGDLTVLQQMADDISARLTTLEENEKGNQKEWNSALDSLRKQVEVLSKKAATEQKRKGTLLAALKQGTWIAAILASAWVITALLKFFGG